MRGEVMRWLLDSDPVIRWQVMRDLGGEDGASVDRERSKIEREGWGRALLERQRADGRWGGGASVPLWQSTLGALELLCAFGLDPAGERAERALALVEERVTWGPEFGDTPFFEGETEPCINGRVLLIGAAFGRPSRRLMERLLGEQLEDGGWNCEAERGSSRSSFHTTICVLEGLLACVGCWGASGELADSIARGREYLLERRLFRRASTGEPIIDRKGARDWARFAFPSAWRYDLVRGLD